MHSMQRLSVLVSLLLVPFVAEAQGLDTAKIDQALGRSGQKMGDVYRAGFPRSDLHVLVHGVPIKTGLALGSWAAFSGSDDNATVMGDLVLLQAEVNPVMEKLRAAGFQITAVHNHPSRGDSPSDVHALHGAGTCRETCAIPSHRALCFSHAAWQACRCSSSKFIFSSVG